MGSSVTSHGEEKPSSRYPEMNSTQDKAHCLHPRFLQFLKLDPPLHGQNDIDVLAGETDNAKGQCNAGDENTSESYFIHDSDSRKVKGTTNLMWVLKECVLAGCDSRSSTVNGNIDSDSVEKFTMITNHVLATKRGYDLEATQTWKHMARSISNEVRAGIDPDRVRRVGMAGHLMERRANANSSEFLIAGLQSEGPTCFHLIDNKENSKERVRALTPVKNWIAIGSGSRTARNILARRWIEHGNDPPLKEGIHTISWSLLEAALSDPFTVGLLTVIHIGPDGIKIVLSKTVLELYREYYDISLLVRRFLRESTQDGSLDMRITAFRDIEGVSVFLLYVPDYVNKKVLENRLKVKYSGHLLTELTGGYYMRRVIFETEVHATRFVEKTEEIPEHIQLPFSTSRDYFRFMKIQKRKVFVARQSLQMLESLEISANLKKPLVLKLCKL